MPEFVNLTLHNGKCVFVSPQAIKAIAEVRQDRPGTSLEGRSRIYIDGFDDNVFLVRETYAEIMERIRGESL